MQQGLGHIYGAPKMKATILLREEFTQSTQQHESLRSLLTRLTDQARPQSYTSPIDHIGAIDAINVLGLDSVCDPNTQSHRILLLLDQIRATSLARANYLDCLLRQFPLVPLLGLSSTLEQGSSVASIGDELTMLIQE